MLSSSISLTIALEFSQPRLNGPSSVYVNVWLIELGRLELVFLGGRGGGRIVELCLMQVLVSPGLPI